MKKYVVWFEAFGKKLRTTVEAENEYKAMDAVKNKIIFYKVVEKDSDELEQMKGILGIK
jgi:hypothetical protein